MKPTITIPETSSGNILLNFTEGIKDQATYDKDDFVLTNEGTVIAPNSISIENDKVKFGFGVAGHDWTEDTSVGATKQWRAVTSSSDGTNLAAIVYDGNIWTSSNSGATWSVDASVGATKPWYGITSSADGTKLAAVASHNNSGGNIWISTDSGATWTENNTTGASKNWVDITSSADGTNLAAAGSSG